MLFLTEFAADLQHRLVGQDVYFRAVITLGGFDHYQLKNIDCFFGEALIDAYSSEKRISSIGLFIYDKCNKYNQCFGVERFDQVLQFVYLTPSLETINKYFGTTFPIDDPSLYDQLPFLHWELRFLKDVYENMRKHPKPEVRSKFLTAWDFYKRRYTPILNVLERNDFSVAALFPVRHVEAGQAAMEREIRYYKRLGSGSSLSKRVQSKF